LSGGKEMKEKAGKGGHRHRVEEFQEERERLNKIVMRHASLKIKRFYALDSEAYRKGALPAKAKEMVGLVASLVLRCDDCILYHLIRCREEGITEKELEELVNVGLVVGGSITIPHIRRLFDAWEEMGAK
jgi:AhpD family alkylhydroperoxidase